MSQQDQAESPLSLYEEELYGEKEVREATRQLIVFSLGPEYYGLDVCGVCEVLASSQMTLLPNVPPHIKGIINLRGIILSVSDLKVILGLPESSQNQKNQIVVAQSCKIATGFWVDGNTESIEISISKIQPLVSTLDAQKASLMQGQVDYLGRLVTVLDVDAVIQKTRVG
ncbi:MAG: purine-binding chemotaxis protein CheW [Chlamydiae bacterium]|nr:purine-binding chemotaxis protein CheW [Chlamydiota bacterium]MBI3266789.1 purine-binding chemotaxis protein CheW [Chlamydiota bacterium]